MRRVLRLPAGADATPSSAEHVFSKSVVISAVRCLFTYLALPVLRPVVDLTGGVGPALGVIVSVISVVAIVASMRRFFAAHHRMRWHYTAVGGSLLVLVVVQGVIDAATLLS